MHFRVKTTDPKSHLMLCSAINIFEPYIVDSGIFAGKEKDFYGFFSLDGSPDMIESIYHLPGIILELPRELPPGKKLG